MDDKEVESSCRVVRKLSGHSDNGSTWVSLRAEANLKLWEAENPNITITTVSQYQIHNQKNEGNMFDKVVDKDGKKSNAAKVEIAYQ